MSHANDLGPLTPPETLSAPKAVPSIGPDQGRDMTPLSSEDKTRLDEMPGFLSFHLLKGPEKEDHTLYSSHTSWASKEDFTAWTKSEQFRESHRNAGQPRPKPMYLGHPEFEGFETVLSETNPHLPRQAAE